MATVQPTRSEALAALERRGLTGNLVYLLDVVPLIEMAWADGEVHPSERTLILSFLDQHLSALEHDASGPLVSRVEALRFVDRYLETRPSPEELQALRELMVVVRLPAEADLPQARRILEGALAVGGIATSPAQPNVSWDRREVMTLWSLEDALLSR